MELELSKNNILDIGDNIKNASTIVSTAFNNSLDKELNNMGLAEKALDKVKKGFEKINLKEIASKTIDTAMKTTLKAATGMKAKTVDSLKDIGKAIRDSDLKGGLKGVLNATISSIKGIPTSIKKVVTDGVDLILGNTFDNELQKVMVTQKNTLTRIDKKCNEFEKAFSANNEKDMKKYANGITKDLEKISLISETIDRGKEIVNRYELMKNKGSTELNSIEQELVKML